MACDDNQGHCVVVGVVNMHSHALWFDCRMRHLCVTCQSYISYETPASALYVPCSWGVS